MKLYMSVTDDLLELPAYVALTSRELAEHYGMKLNTLKNYISLGTGRMCGRDGRLKFIIVDMGDDNELLEEQKQAKRAVRKAREIKNPRAITTTVFNAVTSETLVFTCQRDAEIYLGMSKKYIAVKINRLKKNEFRYKHYIVKVGN